MLLNDNNICYFNINPQNIIFLENYREKPVLSNFRFSLRIGVLDHCYFLKIISDIKDFTYLPFEVHVLYYFLDTNMLTISYSFIEEMSEKFVENLNILRLFSNDYKTMYKRHCIEVLKEYINMPKDEIISDILERNDKWDIYGLSMLYLQIFGCIFRVFSLKGTTISKIIGLLFENLHPNSDKRLNLEETLEVFNKYINEQNDWQFVNNLDDNRLPKLFDEFEK